VSTNAQPSSRLDFIDAHRGVAVLLMLWMHTADGWLRPELRHGATWDVIRALGGLAAPTFLLLAGVGLGLGWGASDDAQRSPQQASASRRMELARALQLVVLGYALRVQMWMLDAGGVRLAEAWAAALPLGAAFVAAYYGLHAWARGMRTARLLGFVAALGALIGYGLVATLVPDRFGPLFRVDVLQAIGASLALLVALRGPLRRRPQIALWLASAIALLTPLLRTWMPGPLPPALAGYIAQWTPRPGQSLATLFPLFPWMSYALVGAGIGMRFGQAQRRGEDAARVMLALAGASIALVLLTCEPLPAARLLREHWPWLTQWLRAAYRVGAALLLGGLAIGLAHPKVPSRGVLIALGRASLVVYWVHLQFAFGAAAKPIARALDFEAWAFGLGLLTAAMAVLALTWVRFRERLRKAAGARAARAVNPDPAALGT
jgi:uncharacterized membrane protein